MGFSVTIEMNWQSSGPVASLLSSAEPSLPGSGDLLQGHRWAEPGNEMNHLAKLGWWFARHHCCWSRPSSPSRGWNHNAMPNCASAPEEIRIYNMLYKEYMFQ